MGSLTDFSLMPFGKHKDKKMMDVPADYILYMYKVIKPGAPTKMTLAQKLFIKYVESNKEVLEKQAKENKNAR